MYIHILANIHASGQFQRNGRSIFAKKFKFCVLFKFEENNSCITLTHEGAICEIATGTRCLQQHVKCTKSKRQTLPNKTVVTSISLLIGNQTLSYQDNAIN